METKRYSKLKKIYENFIYKAVSLFVIKVLDSHRNPGALIDYIKDSDNVLSTLKYFPFVNLHKADLRAADLYGEDLRTANLTGAKMQEAIVLKPRDFRNVILDENTNFYDAITDDNDLFRLLETKIKSGNMPILVENKGDLKKGLKK